MDRIASGPNRFSPFTVARSELTDLNEQTGPMNVNANRDRDEESYKNTVPELVRTWRAS